MAEQTTFSVVLTGGGSGGHIYPLFAVADALRAKVEALGGATEFTYIGPRDSYASLIEGKGIAIRAISAGKVRRYFSIENVLDIPKFLIGAIQALWHLYVVMPDVVFSKGGTGAFPVVLAAWFYRIPVAIHESDAVPGLTNSASARFARKIFVSFPRAAERFDPTRTVVSGAPIRPELLLSLLAKEDAKEALNFSKDQPLTLVMGGSQGSVRINEFVAANLAELVTMTQVLHQTGVANFDDVRKLSNASLAGQPAEAVIRYQPINYLADKLRLALAAADLVVMRPGGSIFEIAAFGIPAILIPLAESANDHQRVNAYEFANAGGGAVIEETNLLPGIFLSQCRTILGNADIHAKMSAASKKFFTPNGAETIADGIIAMAAGN